MLITASTSHFRFDWEYSIVDSGTSHYSSTSGVPPIMKHQQDQV
jgi:hypothetical protein